MQVGIKLILQQDQQKCSVVKILEKSHKYFQVRKNRWKRNIILERVKPLLQPFIQTRNYIQPTVRIEFDTLDLGCRYSEEDQSRITVSGGKEKIVIVLIKLCKNRDRPCIHSLFQYYNLFIYQGIFIISSKSALFSLSLLVKTKVNLLQQFCHRLHTDKIIFLFLFFYHTVFKKELF